MIVPREGGGAPPGTTEAQAPGRVAPRSSGRARPSGTPLVERFQLGLDAPICLTWELTYACNLACTHCLSCSGRRDPGELSTEECMRVIDELEAMQVFYVNVGGGEPTIRRDFFELLEYATAHHVGVKFSTNGTRITRRVADRLAGSDYLDVQISLDGATRGGQRCRARTGLLRRGAAGDGAPGRGRLRGVQALGRRHPPQRRPARRAEAIADLYGAQLRVTRLRPSGRAVDVWDELHPTRRPAAPALRLAAASTATGAHRRLVLPPLGARGGRCPGSTCAAPAASSA